MFNSHLQAYPQSFFCWTEYAVVPHQVLGIPVTGIHGVCVSACVCMYVCVFGGFENSGSQVSYFLNQNLWSGAQDLSFGKHSKRLVAT